MTVDRIENGIAVIENDDGTIFEIPVEKLPTNIKEGSVLIFDGSYKLDTETEKRRRKENAERTRRLFSK